jgi:hypothetical protein
MRPCRCGSWRRWAALGGEVKPIEGVLTDYYGATDDGFLETVLNVPRIRTR